MYTTLPNSIRIFSRQAGSPSAPTILLLHGFPSSSFQYRNLIPLLAEKYHVVAPDLPGFGFTEVPSSLNYSYTFANLADTVDEFLTELKITSYAIYIFDYGAPVGLRLTLKHPERTTAIISQNGNAYEEGLAPFWDPLKALWKDPSNAALTKQIEEAVLTLEATKAQYFEGEKDPETTVDPATYHLDYALMKRPGNFQIQLDLFKDYANNVTLYPEFQAYFRKSQVPVLAAWGGNDFIFAFAAAEAFKRDVKNAQVVKLDGGHFVLEANYKQMADLILEFLGQLRL